MANDTDKKSTHLIRRIFRFVVKCIIFAVVMYLVIAEIDRRFEEPSFWSAAYSVPTYIFLGLVIFGLIWLLVSTFKKK